MSALPAAVKKQIAKANELAKQIQQQPDGVPSEPAPVEPQETGAPVQVAQEATPPPPAPAQPAPVAAAAPVSEETWEQKYRVLKGKYDAEVPRLSAQIRELVSNHQRLQDQLTTTQTLLSSLSSRGNGAQAPNADGAQPAAPGSIVKDEEIREFGPDLYDFIRRAARQELLPEIDTRIRPVTQQIEQTATTAKNAARGVAQVAEQEVHALLNREVPNWMQLNEDEAFLVWLDQVDPFSGHQRLELLKQAYTRHDGPRVVMFFKSFLKENAVVTPSQPPAAQENSPAAPQVDLNSMVAPGTPKAGTAGAQDGAGKRIWSRPDVAQFYRDVTAGKYRKNPKRMKELEHEIFMAQQEGRIR